MTRVLFIPDVEGVRTAERTPLLYRTLKESHDVIGLRVAWDHLIYNTERAKVPRYLLYFLDKLVLGLRGLRLARRHSVDLVVCASSHHALPGLAIAKILGLQCVWDSQGNVKLFSESLGKGAFFSRISMGMEKFLGERVDALVTVSPRDAEAYAEMGIPQSKIHVIPISVVLRDIDAGRLDTVEAAGHAPRKPVLLFFGSFRYSPNLEGLRFINDVLAPYLERKGVPCDILIAGRDIPEVSYHPFVKPLGFIHAIHDLVRGSDLSLVPVWKGVGILTKVLDSMAVGTPVVLTDFVAGLVPGVEDGINAFVAPSKEEFSKVVLEALADAEASEAVAREARRLVEERYDWGLYTDHLDQIVKGEAVSNWEA